MDKIIETKFLFNSASLNIELNINQLLLVNAHLGHTRRFLNVKIKPYLLGYRGNVYILNLSFTLHQFKLVALNIINLIAKRRKILIVKDRARVNLKPILNLRSLHYYDSKWIGGLLTNFKKVKDSPKCQINNGNFHKMRYLPSLVFFCDINLSNWALIESSNLEIPIAALIDTNTIFLNHVNYPIIANNKPIEAISLYFKLIRNAALKGRQKELLKILRIL